MNISLRLNRYLLILLFASSLWNVRRAESQQIVTGQHTFAPVVQAPTLLIQSPDEWLQRPPAAELDGEANAAPVLWASVIEQGRIAFEESCTQCHEAEQALEQSKSFDEWLVVIQEMSEKEDADIDADSFHRIAAYLASRSAAEIQAAADSRAESESNPSETDMGVMNGRSGSDASSPSPALVAAGEAAFHRSCVKCHDAERSLSKRKSLAAWRATVNRMAAKDGADVRSRDVEAIATFLASQGAGEGDIVAGASDAINPWSFSTTLSTLHRASSDSIENPGFFVDAWMGADWQSDGPLRATVMVCTSCHSDRNTSKGFTLELVEASATVDLKMIFSDHHAEKSRSNAYHSMNGDGHDGMFVAAGDYDCPVSTSADLKMGRFVVPFGVFSSVSHPGSYRTVSNPLMYNMGRRLNTGGPYQPVLPAPYSDEGVNLHFALREYCDRSYTLDFFAVNGLQGNPSGVNFNLSRSYTDNNRSPAVGGRVTLGNQIFRLGASGMTGRMQNDGSAPLDYHLVGADASIHAKKLRAFFEYAIRVDELGLPERNETDGYIVELEYKLRERLGLLARYDTLEHRLVNADQSTTERFTWGLNFTLNRAGLLLLNHEHWMLDNRSDVDVVGLRWVATF